ncbi:MAG TPA: DNA-directed RNA polymerase subunit alpha C-terminal domain-containing protein [Candidatus Angelobacter sp.]|jgi:hypothetical protein|nr:DNA-directed RNA polymerase subunit alpha C-terminal domain-containing protein [Candidatus Angelobacter sp.]
MANEEHDDILDRSVEDLDLSSRVISCLKRDNIRTLRELIQKSEKDLLRIKNCGRKHVDEINRVLARLGLSLVMNPDAAFATASSGFTITFDSTLSPEQIKGALHALADYYRACGGVGFEIEFELEDILVAELVYV